MAGARGEEGEEEDAGEDRGREGSKEWDDKRHFGASKQQHFGASATDVKAT